ncbi:putative adhesin [Streptomyces sp. TLI_185]|nr:putative adhesin [Streptomyces sp. TLI_185]
MARCDGEVCTMSEWSVGEPRKLTFDKPVRELHVRIVNGTVNVVGTDEGSARLEVSEIEGPPLLVSQQGGTLTVAYDDLPWKGFLKWLDRKGWRRSAVVSLAVPADTRVEVGVVGAAAVVSGIDGRTEVKGVTGDTTLVGLTGPVRADTVSGNLEAQALRGDLRFNSVSGDLTVVEAGSSVKADSVSGSMIVDLDPASRPTDIVLANVSGEIAIRLPHPADAEVEANTASGTVSNAFEDLRVSGQWGAKRITGRLGSGSGSLKATTVSGSIALLRRPPAEEEPWDVAPEDIGPLVEDTPPADSDPSAQTGPASTPADGPHNDSGDNSVSGQDDQSTDDSTDDPADGTTDKKVL